MFLSIEKQQHTALAKNYWITQINQLAKNGMRVLAIAFHKPHAAQVNLLFKDAKKDFTLIGIVGIIDPPREGAHAAVSSCQRAGMRVKMVTRDHGLTAQAIAKQVGILSKQVLSGENLDVLNDAELTKLVDRIDIYARTVPEHKIRLIKALRARKHEEGRNVYNNFKKAILFILPSSGAEGFVVFCAILLGYTLPITLLQILWVNLVTAVTLALALAFEPPEKDLMSQKPRNPREPLLSKFLIWRIGFVSLLFVACMFGLFIYEINQGADIALARTMVVAMLVFLEAIYLINCRYI